MEGATLSLALFSACTMFLAFNPQNLAQSLKSTSKTFSVGFEMFDCEVVLWKEKKKVSKIQKNKIKTKRNKKS